VAYDETAEDPVASAAAAFMLDSSKGRHRLSKPEVKS
jgi:hypothetical protein